MKRRISLLTLIFMGISLSLLSQNRAIRVSDNLEVIKLSEKLYLYVSSINTESWGRVGANGLLVVESGEVLMLDTPWDNAQSEELCNWAKETLDATVTTVIPTHWHDDCMGGLGYLQSKGVKSYASQKTIDIAKEKSLPVPEFGFSDSIKIEFNSTPVECFYFGNSHTVDVIVVWLPDEKILFAGDISKDINSTGLGNIAEADLKAWPRTLQKVIDRFPDAKVVIPGHGNIGGPELLHHTLKLLTN